jgi:hypothetical protein
VRGRPVGTLEYVRSRVTRPAIPSFQHRRHNGRGRVEHKTRAAAIPSADPIWTQCNKSSITTVELAEVDRNVAISIRCHCVHVDWRRESPKLRNCQGALGHLNRVGAQGCFDARSVSFYCHRSVTWPSCAMLELTAQPCPQTTIVGPSYPRSCWTTEALPSSASVSLSSTS